MDAPMQPRLTNEHLRAMVLSTNYLQEGTLTICILTLHNGAQVVGNSNVISPKNFDKVIGKTVAFEDAIDKLWELEGYATKTRGWKDAVPA